MKRFSWFVGVILSLGVVVYVILNLNIENVRFIFHSLRWSILGLAFFIYLLNYVLRTFRFNILLSLSEIPFPLLFGVTDIYGMYLYLLPAKFGEISFPLLLKRRLNVEISKTTGTMIVARLYDFFTISIFLGVVLIYYWQIFPMNLRIISLFFCAVVVIVSILFLWAVRNSSQVTSLLGTTSESKTFLGKLRDFIVKVYEGMQVVEKNGKYLALLVLTIGIWLCVNGNFLLITMALGYSFNFFQIIVVSMIMVPVTLFPIQGFANLGAHEVGWVAAFALFGYSYQSALDIAVSSHIVYVFFVILLGFLGFLLISFQKQAHQEK